MQVGQDDEVDVIRHQPFRSKCLYERGMPATPAFHPQSGCNGSNFGHAAIDEDVDAIALHQPAVDRIAMDRPPALRQVKLAQAKRDDRVFNHLQSIRNVRYP